VRPLLKPPVAEGLMMINGAAGQAELDVGWMQVYEARDEFRSHWKQS